MTAAAASTGGRAGSGLAGQRTVSLNVSYTTVRNTRASKSTCVVVAAVAASEMREAFIPAALATCSSVSPLWRNSDERSVSAGTEA